MNKMMITPTSFFSYVCFFCYEKDTNNIVIYCEEDNKDIVVIFFFLCVFLYFKIQLKPLLKEVKVFTKRFFFLFQKMRKQQGG